MKKLYKYVFLVLFLLVLGACGKNPKTDQFKEMYEQYNGEVNASGVAYRTVNVDDDHPFVISSAEEIIDKMNQGETFYVYFGFATCPWCRSVLESAIRVAKENQISKIYYVDIYDIRDVFSVKDGTPVRTTEGSEGYMKLLELLSPVLSSYTLTTSDGKTIDTQEKRIYAPNYVYVENGKAKLLVEGTSPLQTDSHMELTEEILNDQRKEFERLFQHE